MRDINIRYSIVNLEFCSVFINISEINRFLRYFSKSNISTSSQSNSFAQTAVLRNYRLRFRVFIYIGFRVFIYIGVRKYLSLIVSTFDLRSNSQIFSLLKSTKHFIKNNSNVIFTRANKGNTTVLG